MFVGVGVLEGDFFGYCGRRSGDGSLYILLIFVVLGKVYFDGVVGWGKEVLLGGYKYGVLMGEMFDIWLYGVSYVVFGGGVVVEDCWGLKKGVNGYCFVGLIWLNVVYM